jgi:hypothetical protein
MAEGRFIPNSVYQWILDGVSPKDINSLECSNATAGFLGHMPQYAPVDWIEAPLQAACAAKANPRTGAIPPMIYGCYTVDHPRDTFDLETFDTKQCFCDYYLCDPAHQEPFEEAVEFVVSLLDKLER